MKKHIYINASLIIGLSGCVKKVDSIFSESPDERINKVLTAYKTKLMQAPGWKLFVYPEGLVSQDIDVGGITYYVTFPDSNRTQMVSDFTQATASVPDESSYHLKATQRPSLVFDTYSYIHEAADPDTSISFSPTNQGGYGWGTDYDFSFEEVEPRDTLFLEGNFNSSQAIMLPATQEEIDAAFSGDLEHIMQVTTAFSEDNSFLFYTGSDNAKVGVSFNVFLKKINFTYLGSGTLQSIPMSYSHTTYGIHLKTPVTAGGYTFQDLFWDDALDLYYINTGSGRVNITNSSTPLFPFGSVIGKFIVGIFVPLDPLPGQSATFATVYNDVKTNLATSGLSLNLLDMQFVFDDQSKLMALLVDVEQFGINYVAQYVYSYTPLGSDNRTKFIRQYANGNGNTVETDMAPLLDYIDNDVFKLDYYTATTPVLGQFTSQNNPDFFFTGNLQ
jgi:hypothetical protein